MQQENKTMASLEEARSAACRCVNAVMALAEAAYEGDRPDPSPYLLDVWRAVQNGWLPIGHHWPELADAYLVMLFDESLGLPTSATPPPVTAWLLARRAFDYALIADRQEEVDLDAFGTAASRVENLYDPAISTAVVATPGQVDRASAIWSWILRFTAQEFYPLHPTELLTAIEAAVARDAVAEKGAFPAEPQTLLHARDFPDEGFVIEEAIQDLQTHITALRDRFKNQAARLATLLVQSKAWDDRNESSSTSNTAALRTKLAAVLSGTFAICETRLPRPTQRAISCIDRSQLAARVRRYAWARLELIEQLKRAKWMLGAQASTDIFAGFAATSNEYTAPLQQAVDNVQAAGQHLITFFELRHRALSSSAWPSEPGPMWKKETREFLIDGKRVKKYTRPARRQLAVLGAFEEERWPDFIDLPIPTSTAGDTITELNKISRPFGVEFFRVGDGERMGWRRMS